MKEKNRKSTLIRSLLSDQINDKEVQELSQLDMIESEMKKQWSQPDGGHLDKKVGEEIWRSVKDKCINKKNSRVHLERCL